MCNTGEKFSALTVSYLIRSQIWVREHKWNVSNEKPYWSWQHGFNCINNGVRMQNLLWYSSLMFTAKMYLLNSVACTIQQRFYSPGVKFSPISPVISSGECFPGKTICCSLVPWPPPFLFFSLHSVYIIHRSGRAVKNEEGLGSLIMWLAVRWA